MSNLTKLSTPILLIGSLILAGCATTPKLTSQQCTQANWQDIGQKDGMQGHSAAYFSQYIATCPNITPSSPARKLWEAGRQSGLGTYCTELNAYKLGREGYDWQPVCPIEGIEKLEDAYSEGRYYYQRQRDLDYLSSPYPWGYSRFDYTPWGSWSHRW